MALLVPMRRTPHGVRGLKFDLVEWINRWPKSRTPHGVRGLKYRIMSGVLKRHLSHPARGAWIEILLHPARTLSHIVAPRTGCVD